MFVSLYVRSSVSKESKSFISSTASPKTSICSVAANHVTFGFFFFVVFCFSSNAVFVCFFLIYYLSVCPSGVSPPCLYSYSNKCSLTNKMGRVTRPALAPPAGSSWELTDRRCGFEVKRFQTTRLQVRKPLTDFSHVADVTHTNKHTNFNCENLRQKSKRGIWG